MALGNWTHLVYRINKKNKAELVDSNIFSGKIKYFAKIYKSWLYIYEKSGDGYNTIAELYSGTLQFTHPEELYISCFRGPQNGIFGIIKEGFSEDLSYNVFAFCGVYGYEEDDWVGVNHESKEFLDNLINRWWAGEIYFY